MHPLIDSSSVGDPGRFLSLERLQEGLRALPAAPWYAGRVVLIVSRGESGRREAPARVRLAGDAGVPGDAWGRSAERNPEAQIATMQADVAGLIANGQPLFLSGDNLFLDFDLSAANLPTGSRLRAGGAELEVTPKPHNGCRKFRARFGEDALRFTLNPETRHRNLRGIYLRVVRDGEVSPGDPVEVLYRAPVPPKEAR